MESVAASPLQIVLYLYLSTGITFLSYISYTRGKIGSFQFSQEEGSVPSAVWFNVWNWNSDLLLSWSSSILEVCGLSATAPLLPLGSGSLLPP